MQIWDDDDAFLFRLRIPYNNLGESLAGLRLKRTTDLQGFPHRVRHRRELALVLYPLKALQTSFVETEYNSLRLSHVDLLSRAWLLRPGQSVPDDIINVNLKMHQVISRRELLWVLPPTGRNTLSTLILGGFDDNIIIIT
jgi:hypothetical protein